MLPAPYTLEVSTATPLSLFSDSPAAASEPAVQPFCESPDRAARGMVSICGLPVARFEAFIQVSDEKVRVEINDGGELESIPAPEPPSFVLPGAALVAMASIAGRVTKRPGS
jgi:hypothetical protein